MTKRVCATPGCPTLIATTGHCPTHTRQRDKARGTNKQRGYDNEHIKLRKQWAPKVATGQVNCWRCGNPIEPNTTWHLGHNDTRTAHNGPEHAHCNLSAAGKAAHKS